MSAAARAQPAFRPAAALVYYPGLRCPACLATAWEIGRITAQCARCKCAVALGGEQAGAELGVEADKRWRLVE